jgi:hypothetical protein
LALGKRIFTEIKTRLQNKLKPIDIDPNEQILTELRMAVCKSAQDVYLGMQRDVLGGDVEGED